MVEKEIALLQEQLKKLEDKKVNFEAWKTQTVIFLERIFGTSDSKVTRLAALKRDFSSWNLRDTSGSGKLGDPVKMQAYETIEAAIRELETFGLPQKEEATPSSSVSQMDLLLQDELTGKEYRELIELINSEKKNEISEFINKLGNEKCKQLLLSLLLSLKK